MESRCSNRLRVAKGPRVDRYSDSGHKNYDSHPIAKIEVA